jgi:hypothetical protein
VDLARALLAALGILHGHRQRDHGVDLGALFQASR